MTLMRLLKRLHIDESGISLSHGVSLMAVCALIEEVRLHHYNLEKCHENDCRDLTDGPSRGPDHRFLF